MLRKKILTLILLSERNGSSVEDRSDNPWDSCWHMALTALDRSTIGDVSGIGVTGESNTNIHETDE